MSIEAMSKAYEALNKSRPFDADNARMQRDAMDALRTAIQQAESEPVGEPRARVELMKTGGNAGLSTRIIELDIATRERLRPGDLLYTHPAPGVPEDVAQDAQRYRWLRRKACVIGKTTYCGEETGQPILDFVNLPDVTEVIRRDSATTLDAAIDAAMLAAK